MFHLFFSLVLLIGFLQVSLMMLSPSLPIPPLAQSTRLNHHPSAQKPSSAGPDLEELLNGEWLGAREGGVGVAGDEERDDARDAAKDMESQIPRRYSRKVINPYLANPHPGSWKSVLPPAHRDHEPEFIVAGIAPSEDGHEHEPIEHTFVDTKDKHKHSDG
jgi:hypothetical protein